MSGNPMFVDKADAWDTLLRDAYRHEVKGFNKGIEAAARIAETNQLASRSPGPLYGAGWSAANKADAAAIRALKKEEPEAGD